MRLTWTIGGAGLVLCGVTGMLQYAAFGIASVVSITVDIVFAAAVLLFAVGLSRDASVVARRPFGMIALAVVALWPFVVRIERPFLPTMDAATYDAGLVAYRSAESVLTAVSYLNLLVTLAAALIATVQIARAGTVPTPWRWAPLWALIASVAALVLPQLLFVFGGSTGMQNYLASATILGALGFLSRTLGLGILALMLAAHVAHGSVEVYRST